MASRAEVVARLQVVVLGVDPVEALLERIDGESGRLEQFGRDERASTGAVHEQALDLGRLETTARRRRLTAGVGEEEQAGAGVECERRWRENVGRDEARAVGAVGAEHVDARQRALRHVQLVADPVDGHAERTGELTGDERRESERTDGAVGRLVDLVVLGVREVEEAARRVVVKRVDAHARVVQQDAHAVARLTCLVDFAARREDHFGRVACVFIIFIYMIGLLKIS